MNIKIALAGAASALLLGSFAVAQTTTTPDASASMQSDTSQPGAVNDQSTTGAATSADQYSADTAAQSDTSMAGERG